MSVGDPRDLREDQYKDSSNLRARGALHARFSTNPHGWFRWVWDHVDLPQRSRVLELGSGPGVLWTGELHRVPDQCRVVLSDNSAGMVREARERLRSESRFRFAVLDAQAIPFAAGAFDAIIANHMLYHVPDLSRTLSEIHRVLRPLHRYDDSLVVGEAEPLAAYVFSMPTAASQRARRESFRRFVERRLAVAGPLAITKDAGLFEATKA